MDKARERLIFDRLLDILVDDKNITERDIFRLAFISICGGKAERAKELKDNCLKKLGREASIHEFFEGYMCALYDEVVEQCAHAFSAPAQIG